MERAVEHEQGVRGTETDVGGQSGPSEGWETIARTVRASLTASPTARVGKTNAKVTIYWPSVFAAIVLYYGLVNRAC